MNEKLKKENLSKEIGEEDKTQGLVFKLFRKGLIDGVSTHQEITEHDCRYDWSDALTWLPETPYYAPAYVLRCVRVETDGDTLTRYYVARFSYGEWRDANDQKLICVDKYHRVHWKLI
jgi:hypothetical protein